MAIRPRKRERGAVTVEFVLVLPFFLALLFEVINYGVMLSFRQTMSQAAAEGARAAAVAPPYLDGAARIPIARQAINEAFEGQMGPAVTCDNGRLTCTIEPTPSCTTPPCRIKVKLAYLYRGDPNRDVMPHIFGSSVNPLPVTLTYTASARFK